MLNRIIDFHLRHRWFVVIGLLGLIALGLQSFYLIPIDAFPDLTNNQIVVITECPAMAPAEVEMLVTFPIETALMGLPKTTEYLVGVEARPVDGDARLRGFRRDLFRAADRQ